MANWAFQGGPQSEIDALIARMARLEQANRRLKGISVVVALASMVLAASGCGLARSAVAASVAVEYGFTDIDGKIPRPLTLANV